MKRLYALETLRSVILSGHRTKKKAQAELRKLNRKGVKATIREYVKK